jgi:hypothetical protein
MMVVQKFALALSIMGLSNDKLETVASGTEKNPHIWKSTTTNTGTVQNLYVSSFSNSNNGYRSAGLEIYAKVK